MTTVVIRKDSQGNCQGFICMGHADYAKRSLFRNTPDVLCAGISAIVTNTINALDVLAGEKLTVTQNEQTGFLKCDFENALQEKSIILLDAMILGLEQLSKEYGTKYLQVKFEEV